MASLGGHIMTDPLEIKPFAILIEEPGSRPHFLSPFRRARTILLDNGPLEPQFTMDRAEAEGYVARLKPFYPKAKFEIVEVRSIDPAAMSRRYDESLSNRAPSKHANQNYGPKLAADYHFNKRRAPLIVERKQRRSKVSQPESEPLDSALIRRIVEMVEQQGDRRDGCYASSFRIRDTALKWSESTSISLLAGVFSESCRVPLAHKTASRAITSLMRVPTGSTESKVTTQRR